MNQQKITLAKFATRASLLASLMSIAWISYNAWLAYQAYKLAKQTGKNNESLTDKV